MYSEKDLKIVEQSVPIYIKIDPTESQKKPQRGHFKCGLCPEKSLSSVRTYTTALVYDFDHMGPQFAFLYSRDDQSYINAATRIMRGLAITVNFDWIYLDKLELETHEIHVRGWWDVDKKKKFVHKTGKLQLRDHINFNDMATDGNGDPLNSQYGIKLFIPNIAGMYRHYKEIERMETWSDEQQYENTFIHPLSDKTVGIRAPSWSRYGEKGKPAKKKKTTREQRVFQEITRQREQEIVQMEEDIPRRAVRQRGRATTAAHDPNWPEPRPRERNIT